MQIIGVGGLVTAAALGSQRSTGAQAASSGFAVGGAVALVAGTLLLASGSPYMYGPPPSAFIEMK